MFITETWLRSSGHEVHLKELAPPNYTVLSCARDSLGVPGRVRGGGIAVIVKDSLIKNAKFNQSPLTHPTFEAVILSLTVNKSCINFVCVYRPPPSRGNKFTTAMFFEQFPDFLEHCHCLHGKTILMGDFNVHFDVKFVKDIQNTCISHV